MSFTDNKRSRWFTVADALIIVIALLLLVGAALLFLMPNLKDNEINTVTATLQISFDETQTENISNLEGNVPLFYGDKEIGIIVRKTPDNRTVYAELKLIYENGVFYLEEEPLRINGEFVMETKTQSLTGRIVDIQKEG